VGAVRVLQSKSCVLPWIGQCIQNPGKVTPCCRFVNAGHTMGWVTVGGTGKKLSEYHHRMPQRHFMQDRYPDHCVKCKIEDEQGVKSMRQDFNEIYDDVDTSKMAKMPPRYIEISFGNICNLACRMCNSNDSTRWQGVDRYIHNETKIKRDTWPEWRLEIEAIDIDLSEVDRLKFMGGEPLLHPNHEEFLDKLVAENTYSGRVTARYHTNGTQRPNDRVLEIWEQLGTVEIAFSLDGVDKMNDYIRPPSQWREIEETVQWFKDLNMPNVSLHVHSCYSMLNVLDIENLWNWVKDNGIRIWNRDIVRDPEYLFLGNAPLDYKQRTKAFLQSIPVDTRMLEVCCDHVQNPDHWINFKKINKTVDKYWNNSLKYTNEELWSMT